MHHFSPESKDAILREYREDDVTHGYTALARRHPQLTSRTIRRWMSCWDGAPASLEEGARSGRPPVIQPEDRVPVIQGVINDANRRHAAIHYPEVDEALFDQTGIQPSSRTVRRWGKELGAHPMRTIARSVQERK